MPLSCIYPDNEAAARHAAGSLCARGHRELVYLMAEPTSLGDRLASAAFDAEARRLGASARIVTHGHDMPAVRRAIAGSRCLPLRAGHALHPATSLERTPGGPHLLHPLLRRARRIAGAVRGAQ